jgi:hypothetical protein
VLGFILPAAPRARLIPVFAALAALCASCGRSGGGPDALDPKLEACFNPRTLAIASVDLDRLRGSAAMKELPPESASLLRPFGQASRLAVGYDGREFLVLAQGNLKEAPAGGTFISSGVAAFGSPATIEAARAQSKTGRTGAGWLLQRAAPVALQNDLWAVAVGGTAFPASGAAANLNPLMKGLDYATLAVKFDSPMRFVLTGFSDKPEKAASFEETVRGLLSLTALAAKRQAGVAEAAKGVEVRREGLAVKIMFSAAPARAAEILGGLFK